MKLLHVFCYLCENVREALTFPLLRRLTETKPPRARRSQHDAPRDCPPDQPPRNLPRSPRRPPRRKQLKGRRPTPLRTETPRQTRRKRWKPPETPNEKRMICLIPLWTCGDGMMAKLQAGNPPRVPSARRSCFYCINSALAFAVKALDSEAEWTRIGRAGRAAGQAAPEASAESSEGGRCARFTSASAAFLNPRRFSHQLSKALKGLMRPGCWGSGPPGPGLADTARVSAELLLL
ncbi:hypothetical protein AOLI_G00253790 [Acnodon oligacanthus]